MMLGARTAAWSGGGVPWGYRVEYLDSNNTGAAETYVRVIKLEVANA